MDIQNKIRVKSEDLLAASKPLIDAMAEMKQSVTSLYAEVPEKVADDVKKRFENLSRALNNFIAAL